MARIGSAAAAVLALAVFSCTGGDGETLPIRLDHNRMLVEVEFRRSDGSWRQATAWVDTGNPQLVFGGPLAKDLGVEWDEQAPRTPGGKVDASPPSGMRFGRVSLPLDGVSCAVFPEWTRPFPAVPAEANLPSTLLRRFDVCFDYPGMVMTLGAPGTLVFRGDRVPCIADPTSGIVQTQVTIGGEASSFALDNGATYTLVDERLVARWRREHPDWPSRAGLVGCANLWGMQREPEMPLLRPPEMSVGPVTVAGAGVAGFPGGLFEWYSQKTSAPVAGLLGPNALMAFRVGIDFRGGALYLERRREDNRHDMDLVGLTLRPSREGTFEILEAAPDSGARAGDVLLSVGGLEVQGRTQGEVVDALRGRPGEKRLLTLRRAEKILRVEARVERRI
ncbi:MAG: PDZ domain-containing protein [Acidobacteriota bacterium]